MIACIAAIYLIAQSSHTRSCRCTDCPEIARRMTEARKLFDVPEVSDAMLIAWMMMETNIDPCATPDTSSATGVLQVLESTWESPEMVRGRPKQIDGDFETVLRDPVKGIAAGLWVLSRKPGRTVWDKLVHYGPPGDYAERIRAGTAKAEALLGGKKLQGLSADECERLLREVDRAVH